MLGTPVAHHHTAVTGRKMDISALRFKTTPPDHLEKCLLDGVIMCEALGDSGTRFRLAYALQRLEPGQLTFEQAMTQLDYGEFIELYNASIENLMQVTGRCCSDPSCPHTQRQASKLDPTDEAKLRKLQW